MSQINLHNALKDSAKDDPTVPIFLGLWPNIESILTAFAEATGLPLFVYLNDTNVYTSPVNLMPQFCRELLNSGLSKRCFDDGTRRARKEEPESGKGIQLCHAGMANGRREISISGIGKLTILFGAKKAIEPLALARRENLIRQITSEDKSLATRLQNADSEGRNEDVIADRDFKLMDEISETIQKLLEATVGFQTRVTSTAHELSLMMLAIKFDTEKMRHLIDDFESQYAGLSPEVAELSEIGRSVYTQSQLGLYTVRNFLSNVSDETYQEVVRQKFSQVNFGQVLNEMIELHQSQAAEKGIGFDYDKDEIEALPKVQGFDQELRRLFFNVLSNAIKYSYHSTPQSKRYIKIKTKIPYDPGFHEPRFSISFENYGLGISPEEIKDVFKLGFRSKQARREVPTGSGIGLSESVKIMRAHGGKMKLRSEARHKDAEGADTFLTVVELIFPYGSNQLSTKRGHR